MLKGKMIFGWIIALLFTFWASWAGATTQLDTTFGESGFVLQDFGFGDDEVFALAVQADGKIVAAGYSGNGAVKNMAVARFLEDGTLDVDFSDDGRRTFSFGNGDTIGRSLLIQEDGKIILAGSVQDDDHSIVVVRLTPEGNLDKSFAIDGQLTVKLDEGELKSCDIQMDSNGDVVVAGTIDPVSSSRQAFFAKLDQDGLLDGSFGEEGVVFIKQPYDVEINVLGFLPEGQIVAGGLLTTDENQNAAFLRLTSNGELDASFGVNGEKVLTMEGAGSSIEDLLVTDDGNILFVGAVDNGSVNQTFIGKVDTAGSYVADFGESGLYSIPLEYENVANAVAVNDDGLVIITGFATTETGKDVFIVTVKEVVLTEEQDSPKEETNLSITEDGVLSDKGEMSQAEPDLQEEQVGGLVFSYALTDVADRDDVGYALAILPDGNVLAAGSTENGNNMDFAVLRYVSEDITKASSKNAYETAVATEGFLLLTAPVTNITRVSAVSGGSIEDISTLSCDTGCEQVCAESEDFDCYATCLQECEAKSTIKLHGITFSVDRNPEYASTGTVDAPEEVESDPDNDSEALTVTGSTATTQASYLGDNSAYEGGLFSYDIIRSGQTEDGSGTGSYTSEIEQVSPDITYYVRAYAVLSDDTVIYGNEVMFKSNDACFIATAAYGSLMEKQVRLLREFRNSYLKGNVFGEKIIGTYYHFSPQIADIVAHNSILKAAVRIVLLPFIFIAWFVLKTTIVIKIGLLAGFVGSVGLMVWAEKKNQVMRR